MRFFVAVAVTGLLLAGCATDPDAKTEPAAQLSAHEQIVDVSQESLGAIPQWSARTAPDAPQRIVSLATGVGETLVALGVGANVVGRDEASAVAELAAVPVVTEAHSASAERVLALEPDLVLVDAASGPPEALDQIRAAGVRVVEIPEAWTLADLGPRSQAIADAVGAVDTTIPDFTDVEALPDGPRVAFLYLRGTSAIYLLGGKGSGADALIAAAGGRDVGAELDLPAFTPLTAESLVTADPEVLLVMTKGLESVGGVDGLMALPGVQQTTAAKNRAVISVDDNVLLSFGPRTPQLIELLRPALGSQPRGTSG